MSDDNEAKARRLLVGGLDRAEDVDAALMAQHAHPSKDGERNAVLEQLTGLADAIEKGCKP